MSFFPNRTTFLQIGSISIQWYAILILTGAFLAYFFAKRNLKEYRNIDVDGFFDDAFICLMWSGIIGARLWFCLFYNFEQYINHPLDIIRVWDGGLAIHGGLVGAFIGTLILCKKRNVPFIKFLDAILPTVLLGQAIGRWGNFINQECHGSTVSSEYFDGILSFLKEGMYIGGQYYRPLFFYESILCLIGFILINFLLKKTQTKRGELVGAYCIWYGIVRFFIEGDRTDSLLIGSLKTAQLTSILFVIIGLLLYFGIYDKIFKKKISYVFDLDGTLTDSTPAIIESFKTVFRKYGKEEDFSPQDQVEVLGPPIDEMLHKFFPNEDVKELEKYYRETNKQQLELTLKPIKGALELISELKKQGSDLAILTTRKKESTYRCLELCGFNKDDFNDIITLDDVSKTKPDPEGIFKLKKEHKIKTSDVIVVGDSTADINAAKAFGAYSIAYSVVDGKRKAIEDATPNKIIEDLKDVLEISKEKHYFTYNLK